MIDLFSARIVESFLQNKKSSKFVIEGKEI